jgi:spore germination protein YaaH
MRRFPPREPPQARRPRRDAPRPEGPFERILRRRPERDPAPLIIGGTIAFLAVVIIIVLGFSTLFGGDDADSASDGGSSGDTVEIAPGITATQESIPGLPPGLVAQSDYFEFQAEEDVPITVKLPLTEGSGDQQGLGFYSYLDSRWQRMADATVTTIGDQPVAEGEFPSVPENLSVLLVLPQTYAVAGSLPAGSQLHGDARVTIVSPRDYTPSADGAVTGVGTQVRSPNSVSANAAAQEEGPTILPTIVGSGAETAAIVNEILADDDLRDTHVEAIVTLTDESELDGIDIEYPAVDPELASEFTEFVTRLSDRLHDKNKKLSLTLPPPSEERQAYDWSELGDSADIIKILPLADPVAYWQTMPTAIGQVVRDVSPDKIMLVINPFSIEDLNGVTTPMGYLQAMALAAESIIRSPNPADIKTGTPVTIVARNLDESEGASPIRWNDDAVTVSFATGGTERKRVYVENSYSASFKLELVQAYRLGGLAISDASATSDVANLWPTVNAFVDTATLILARPNDASFLPIWHAEGGDLGAGAGPTATWIAPGQAGTYNVILTVSDGDHRFGRKLAIEVKKGDQPSPTPLQTFGPTPVPSPTAPSLTPTPAAETPPPGTLSIQVGKRADGDDPGNEYGDPETTTSGSEVTYRIVIDNDSPVAVTIDSFVDDIYPGAVCTDNDEEDVVGQTLAADDGDAELVTEKGDDAIVCTFTETVSGSSGDQITDRVTITVSDGTGNTGTDGDSAVIIIS